MIFAIALWAAMAAGNPQDIDVKASLHGYNLLWPSHRCCAFDLHVAPDGRATVSANLASGKEPKEYFREFSLSADQLLQIRQAISDAAFFGLPDDFCCGPMDGDSRSITITWGTRTHRVVFEDDTAAEHRYQLRRVQKLWSVITSQLDIPGANIK
jgi:hypothetical protein